MGELKYKIGIYGTGNMGKALLSGIVSARIAPPGSIIINDADKKKSDSLAGELKVKSGNAEETAQSEIILICVKPQQIKELLADIKKLINKNSVILSIAAGVTTNAIEKSLDKGIGVIRAMPNTPALIRRGVTAVCSNGKLGEEQLVTAAEILSSIGDVIFIDEDSMDAVTAISGSGPAYFYYLADSLIESGIKLGLTREHSTKLVSDTFAGSAALFEAIQKPLADMISMVKSRGGTTEAALDYLSDNGFDSLVDAATEKAKARSIELSAKLSDKES